VGRGHALGSARRLGYIWHIARDRSDAADLALTFGFADGTTRRHRARRL
jgi:hypothetical protein